MANYKGIDLDDRLIGLIRHMHAADEYREILNNLQSVWDNLALLGQLSGVQAEMGGTRKAFHELTGALLNQLGRQILSKCTSEMTSKAQVAIDILVRNLFERTADIGFLATDDDIRKALVRTRNQDRSQSFPDIFGPLRKRFAEYVAKYSVYSDVVLMDTEGKILARLDNSIQVDRSLEPLVHKSIATTGAYVETFGRVDFLPSQPYSLVYSYRVIGDDKQALGVLCLCFRFANEMGRIFADLSSHEDWSVVTLLDAEGRVIASSDVYHIPLGAQLSPVLDRQYQVVRFTGREYLAATCRSAGYQGYAGPDWFAHVMLPLQHAFNWDSSRILDQLPADALDTILQRSTLFAESLRRIPTQAEKIQQDLNRSVWNGNVRKRHTESGNDSGFSKVLLWEVSNTGARTKEVFQRAITNLSATVVSSILEDSRFRASLTIDIMDRNLYERANDCRWWALTSSFRELLAQPRVSEEDCRHIESILQYVNKLYTVYTNLIVFDRDGRILAVSNQDEKSLVGQLVEEEWMQRVLELGDSQRYVVSDFVATRFYNQRHTYIYGAAIHDPHNRSVVGGIGIVFDSEPQFAAMLRDAIPKDDHAEPEKGTFAVFVTRKGKVIACSDQTFRSGQSLPVPRSLLDLNPGEENSDVVVFGKQYYALGARASSGYREYKDASDQYQNEVIAIISRELCTRESRDAENKCPAPTIRSDRGEEAGRVEIATFRIGNEWFALRSSNVIEAVDAGNLTPVPSRTECVGYVRYQGEPIPVFDIGNILEVGQGLNNRSVQQVIVIENSANHRIGLISDALGEIAVIAQSRLKKLPGIIEGRILFADAAVSLENTENQNMLLVLNVESLMQRMGPSFANTSRHQRMPAVRSLTEH